MHSGLWEKLKAFNDLGGAGVVIPKLPRYQTALYPVYTQAVEFATYSQSL